MTTPPYLRLCLLGLLLLSTPSNLFADTLSFSRPGSGIASLQIIHNVADAGPLDVYLDGTLLLDDFDFRTATPFEPIIAGTYTLDFVSGQDADNSNPIFTTDLTLGDVANVVIAQGLLQPHADQPPFALTVIEGARVEASAEDVEIVVIHGASDLETIDVRLLDPVDGNNAFALLANNIDYDTVVLYQDLSPVGYNVEVSAFDNEVQYEVFRLELQAFRGKTLLLILSGSGTSQAEGLEAMLVAANGTTSLAAVITATEEAQPPPRTFALQGNYPNPFNPSTTVQIDLPRDADVRVEVFDVQGRRVLTTPTLALAAGSGRAISLDGSVLPSGLYLYKVLAVTATENYTAWGRMVLVR